MTYAAVESNFAYTTSPEKITVEDNIKTYLDNIEFRILNNKLNYEGFTLHIYSTLSELTRNFRQPSYFLDINANGQLIDPTSGRTMADICSYSINSDANRFQSRTIAEAKAAEFQDSIFSKSEIGTIIMELSPTCDGHDGSRQSMVRLARKISDNRVECNSFLIPENSASESFENMKKFVSFFRSDLSNATTHEELIESPTILNFTNPYIFDDQNNFLENNFINLLNSIYPERVKSSQLKSNQIYQATLYVLNETNLLQDLYNSILGQNFDEKNLNSKELFNLIINIQNEIKKDFEFSESIDPKKISQKVEEIIANISRYKNYNDKIFVEDLIKNPEIFDLMEIGGVHYETIKHKEDAQNKRPASDTFLIKTKPAKYSDNFGSKNIKELSQNEISSFNLIFTALPPFSTEYPKKTLKTQIENKEKKTTDFETQEVPKNIFVGKLFAKILVQEKSISDLNEKNENIENNEQFSIKNNLPEKPKSPIKVIKLKLNLPVSRNSSTTVRNENNSTEIRTKQSVGTGRDLSLHNQRQSKTNNSRINEQAFEQKTLEKAKEVTEAKYSETKYRSTKQENTKRTNSDQKKLSLKLHKLEKVNLIKDFTSSINADIRKNKAQEFISNANTNFFYLEQKQKNKQKLKATISIEEEKFAGYTNLQKELLIKLYKNGKLEINSDQIYLTKKTNKSDEIQLKSLNLNFIKELQV